MGISASIPLRHWNSVKVRAFPREAGKGSETPEQTCGEGQNGHWALLCRIIGPMRCRIAEKKFPFGEEKSALPP